MMQICKDDQIHWPEDGENDATVSAWRVLKKSSVSGHKPTHLPQPTLLIGAFFHSLLSKLKVKIDRIAQMTNIMM